MNKDWFDYATQALTAIGTVGAVLVSLQSTVWPKREKITGEFKFDEEKDLIQLSLKNIGKTLVYFDPQKGVHVQGLNGKFYKIDLTENNMTSFIPPHGYAQLKHSVNFNKNKDLKDLIDSKKFRLFIYTTREKKFELQPSAAQLKNWRITRTIHDENIEDI